VGPLVVVGRYTSSTGPYSSSLVGLSPFGAMRCCWAILLVVGLSLDPYSSSLVGPFVDVGLRSGPIDSSLLERRRALLVFIRSPRHWVVLLFVVGPSFPCAGVNSRGLSEGGLVLYASVERNIGVEHMWSAEEREERRI